MEDMGSLNLLKIFVQNFDINVVYELGWHAATQWVAVVSGVLIAIAIGIRSLEENVKLASGGQTNYQGFFTTGILIAIAIALYFGLAWLVINFFNAIYDMINQSATTQKMAEQLDGLISLLISTEKYEFEMWDVLRSVYAAFAICAYAITFCALVFTILLMRLGHALMVSFCLFWGSVALPMSITVGMKQLTPFRMLSTMALIWPIVEAFIMYLVAGTFNVMIERSSMGLDRVEAWNLGTLVFYFGAFSIINCILIACTISAPFIAQAVATGSGNVSGMLASFGAAGISAGFIAGKQLANATNWAGGTAGDLFKKGMGNLLNRGGQSNLSNADSGSTIASNNSSDWQMQNSYGTDYTNYIPSNNDLNNQAASDMNMAPAEQNQQPQQTPESHTDDNKKKAQARRGAIIHHNRSKGG